MGSKLIVDFSQRAKDLRYLVRNELALDRKWKRQETRIAMAIAGIHKKYFVRA